MFYFRFISLVDIGIVSDLERMCRALITSALILTLQTKTEGKNEETKLTPKKSTTKVKTY